MTPFNKLVQSIIAEMLDSGEEYQDIGPDEDPGGDGFTRRERLEDEIYYLWDEIRKISGVKFNENISDLSSDELEDMVNRLELTLKALRRREDERPY